MNHQTAGLHTTSYTSWWEADTSVSFHSTENTHPARPAAVPSCSSQPLELGRLRVATISHLFPGKSNQQTSSAGSHSRRRKYCTCHDTATIPRQQSMCGRIPVLGAVDGDRDPAERVFIWRLSCRQGGSTSRTNPSMSLGLEVGACYVSKSEARNSSEGCRRTLDFFVRVPKRRAPSSKYPSIWMPSS